MSADARRLGPGGTGPRYENYYRATKNPQNLPYLCTTTDYIRNY